ncbi:hypothetical protein E4T48_03233 [Aureobasidium sp. EXF-10727]|nr:hypothetical protein E4T48_03233 [Aureobasidium sp. EXF-10727]
MISKPSFLLSALALGVVQAFDTGAYGLGYWNETYAFEANENPNATHSVPFAIGTQNYTFQVNVAELTPTGVQANRTENPRQAAAFYNLIWDGDKSLNQSLKDGTSQGQGGIPQLCVTIPMGTLTRSATNGYREQDDGDCTNALGKQCMDDLKKVSTSDINNCNGLWMPDSCKSSFSDGGLASTKLESSSTPNNQSNYNLRQQSPVEFSYYYSQIFSAGNESYYEREDKRLHAVFFSGSWGVTPVCNRVNNTKLGKNDGAVYQGGAAGTSRSVGLLVAMALAVAFVV